MDKVLRPGRWSERGGRYSNKPIRERRARRQGCRIAGEPEAEAAGSAFALSDAPARKHSAANGGRREPKSLFTACREREGITSRTAHWSLPAPRSRMTTLGRPIMLTRGCHANRIARPLREPDLFPRRVTCTPHPYAVCAGAAMTLRIGDAFTPLSVRPGRVKNVRHGSSKEAVSDGGLLIVRNREITSHGRAA